MKKILLATAAVLISASAASAADLAARPYTKAPAYAPPAPIYNWTGFYIGGHIGGAFGGSQQRPRTRCFFTNNNDGVFMGGGQVGYDTQFSPNWVFGIEANYSFLDTGSNLRQPWPRIGHRPARLHLGSGAAVRQGRLRLG